MTDRGAKDAYLRKSASQAYLSHHKSVWVDASPAQIAKCHRPVNQLLQVSSAAFYENSED